MKTTLLLGSLLVLALAVGVLALRWASPGAIPTAVQPESGSSPLLRLGPSNERLERDMLRPELGPADVKLASEGSNARSVVEKPPASITLFGYVRSIDMARMPQHEIRIEVEGKVNKVFVAAGKEYRVSGIPSGPARITIKARDYEPLSEDHEIQGDPPEQRLDFNMQPHASLRVRLVAPNGCPLFEALHADGSFASPPKIAIVSTADFPGRTMPLADGMVDFDYAGGALVANFALRDWHASLESSHTVRPSPSHPVYLSVCRSSAVLVTEYVLPGMKELDLVVPLDAVRASDGGAHLRIVDAIGGGLLDDARARLKAAESYGDYFIAGDVRQSAPIPDGRLPLVGGDVSMPGLEPGAYELAVSAPGREQLRGKVRIEPGAVTELGTYRLSRVAAIEGRVTDTLGGVAKVHVELFPIVEGNPDSSSVAEDCFSDGEGRFKLERVGAHKYLLHVWSKRGVAPSIVVDASQGDVHDVVVGLEPGLPVTFRLDPILQEANEHGSEYSISISDDRRFRILATSISTGGAVRTLLPPGSYSFEATFHGERIAGRSFEVGSTRLELTITP